MDLVLRKYRWAFNLLFIAVGALLLAKTVNLFVETVVAPAPNARRPRSSGHTAPAETIASLNLDKLSKITGMPLPPVPVAGGPDITEPGRTAVDLNALPVKSDLRVKLLGTLLAGSDLWTFASIQDLSTLRSEDYRVGDRVLGAEVLDIERSRVIVANNGRREFISNEDGPAAPVKVADTGGIRSTGENSYEIARTELDKTLGDMNSLAMQARIIPAFKDGVSQGFKLVAIQPNSIYSKIGVVNGDIIKRINGFDLNSPEKALEIYTKLKDSNRIDIELDRNGANLRKQYTVR